MTVGLLPRLGSLTPSSSLIKIVLPSPAGSKASLPKISVWVLSFGERLFDEKTFVTDRVAGMFGGGGCW